MKWQDIHLETLLDVCRVLAVVVVLLAAEAAIDVVILEYNRVESVIVCDNDTGHDHPILRRLLPNRRFN